MNQEDGHTRQPRINSLPAYTKRPSRGSGTKNLAISLPADLQELQQDSTNYLDLYNDGVEYEEDEYQRQQQHQHREEEEYEYVEETNMFGEKIVVKKPKHRLRKQRSSKKSRRPTGPGSGEKQYIPTRTNKDTYGYQR